MRKLILFIICCTLISQPLFAQENARLLVNDIAWSPDGRLLALATSRGVMVYDVSAEAPELLWSADPSLTGWTSVIIFSPYGQRVVTGTVRHASSAGPGMVYVWNSQSGEKIAEFEGNTSAVYSLAFSLDGRQLAVGGGEWRIPIEDYVTFWNTEHWSEIQHQRLEGHGIITDVNYSPNGRLFAFATQYGSVYFIDVPTWTSIAAVHQSNVRQIYFDSESSRIWLQQNTIEEWELRFTPELHLVRANRWRILPTPGVATVENLIGFTPNYYVTASNDGTVVVRSSPLSNEYQRFFHVEDGRQFTRAVFSPDERRVVLAANNYVAIWTLASGEYHSLKFDES